jgi:prepilin-type N-terminal cleavage/methylation domain-containing protein
MKRQLGFTLVEMLVAMSITGLIGSGLGTAIYQILNVTDYGSDRLTAAHELQNTAHWFMLDGQRASTASGGSGLMLTLSADDSPVNYTLEGTTLYRIAGSSNITLAQNITSAAFSIKGRTVTMTITSSPQGRWGVSDNGTYRVYLRPAKTLKEITPVEVAPEPLGPIRGR